MSMYLSIVQMLGIARNLSVPTPAYLLCFLPSLNNGEYTCITTESSTLVYLISCLCLSKSQETTYTNSRTLAGALT
jgi:hypothetical protein